MSDGSFLALRAAPRTSCHARWSITGRTSAAGAAPLAVNAGPSHKIIICSVSWKRRGPAWSAAMRSATAPRCQSTTASSRTTSAGSSVSGPLSLMTPASRSRSRDWPSSLPYQASSARNEVPHAGSTRSRKVRRLERMRRMATRLWWMRSVRSGRRSVPANDSTADWAHSGRVPIVMVRPSTVSVPFDWRTNSSPKSLSRKVRADMASTRCRTMPAVGSGKESSMWRRCLPLAGVTMSAPVAVSSSGMSMVMDSASVLRLGALACRCRP